MKLWKRASGAIKDQNSLILATFSPRTELRNPDIEAAVIKATSHDPSRIDYRNAQRVFAWVRVSSIYLRPIIWAISIRLNKTRDWVVAIKGLLLLHGVFCCKVPGAQRIGRLPFDLSSFKHKHSRSGKNWGYNAFVRAYYSFLDHKSAFIFYHINEARDRKRLEDIRDHENELEREKSALRQELVWIKGLQGMLDMLMQIKPQQDGMEGALILEVMDCIMIEIFDVYGRIYTGIAGILANIYSSWIGKVEASLALGVLQKANLQGEELTLYFEFCRNIGVTNAVECPKLAQFSDNDIQELEQIINRISEKSAIVSCGTELEEEVPLIKKNLDYKHERKDSTSSLQTVITDQWEVFEDDPKNRAMVVVVEGHNGNSGMVKNNARVNPFVELPDLISFI